MAELKAQGVKILAPPIYVMLALDAENEIVPSEYAKAAKAAGLDLIGWSLERDGPLDRGGGFYHPGQGRDRPRRRHADGARRAGETGRRPRHVFGLAGDDDVLCELHGDEVRAHRLSPFHRVQHPRRAALFPWVVPAKAATHTP